MKAVIISSVLLLSVTLGVVLNIFLVSERSEELIRLAQDVEIDSPDSENGFETLKKQWEQFKTVLTYIVDYREVETINVAFLEMENHFQGKNTEDFPVSKDKFIHALERIIEISKITPENIL